MPLEQQTDSRRDEFLLVMYGKMWDNINRHLTVVWESATILAGAVAVFALTENGTLSVDSASTLLVIVSGWTVLHAYDANSWYNRNLAIIANIERLFLTAEDAKAVHYFFLKHRGGDLVDHLRIHAFLGVGFGVVTLLYHFSVRVWPGLSAPVAAFEPQRSLPYLAALCAVIAVAVFRKHYITKRDEFETKSPGVNVSTP
jgi:hypothetical protein